MARYSRLGCCKQLNGAMAVRDIFMHGCGRDYSQASRRELSVECDLLTPQRVELRANEPLGQDSPSARRLTSQRLEGANGSQESFDFTSLPLDRGK